MNHTASTQPTGQVPALVPGDVAGGYVALVRALGGQVVDLSHGRGTLALPALAATGTAAGAAGGSR